MQKCPTLHILGPFSVQIEAIPLDVLLMSTFASSVPYAMRRSILGQRIEDADKYVCKQILKCKLSGMFLWNSQYALIYMQLKIWFKADFLRIWKNKSEL